MGSLNCESLEGWVAMSLSLQRRKSPLPATCGCSHHVVANARLPATIPRAFQNFSAVSGRLVNNVAQIDVSLQWLIRLGFYTGADAAATLGHGAGFDSLHATIKSTLSAKFLSPFIPSRR